MIYRIELAPDDNGTFLATCPALPEVTTFGASKEAAWEHARDAVEEALAARIAAGDDIPLSDRLGHSKPGPTLSLSAQTSIKVGLYQALRGRGVTRAELARRLGWHREQVDRLFRLDHASRLDQIDAAFDALGYRVEPVIVEAM